MAKFLRLEINSLSVTITQFFNEVLPRNEAQIESGVQYTESGSVVVTGPRFESFAFWTVDAPLSETEYETLKLIRDESDNRRRLNTNPAILIYDTTQIHQERAPRTRAIVPGTTVRTQGDYVLYYAQYQGLLSAMEFRRFGRGYAATFTIQELGRVAP